MGRPAGLNGLRLSSNALSKEGKWLSVRLVPLSGTRPPGLAGSLFLGQFRRQPLRDPSVAALPDRDPSRRHNKL